MDTSICSESKKVNLEELSKEDLIKKCKGLLTIAQKAKLAKDVVQEENTKLKQDLSNKIAYTRDASQEIVENLTRQKLSLVTTIEDLNLKNSSLDSRLQILEKDLNVCQEKLNTADIENVSYKRQVTRLTDENEQLITHLESLEQQIDELNKIGIQQQKQLLELESKAHENNVAVDNSKISELQCMLSVSLEEVKKLKTENVGLHEKVENLHINLSEKNKNILVISEELKIKCDILDNITQELNELKQTKEIINIPLRDCDKLESDDKETSNGFNYKQNEQIKDLEDINKSLKEKLKLYHTKIVKFAGNAKALKEERNKILQLFKLYTDQVKEWKEKLDEAGQKMVAHVNLIHADNQKLRENLKQLEKENKELSADIDEIQSKQKSDIAEKLSEVRSSYENELKILKKDHEVELDALKTKLLETELLLSNLTAEIETATKSIREYKNQIEILNSEKKDLLLLKDENSSLRNNMETCKVKISDFNQENERLSLSSKELKQQIDMLINEKKSIEIVHKEKETNLGKQLSDCEKLITELKTKLKNYQDNREHIEATEKQLAERSIEEIKKLVQENNELVSLNNTLQEKLDDFEQKQQNASQSQYQTTEEDLPTTELEEQIANLKRENTELLSEMNEMNQAIKERGENISNLEAHCEEVMKKLQIYETQANKNIDSITEKEEAIKNLTLQIDSLKQNKNSDVNLNETMKDEEINHLKGEVEALKEKLNANLEANYAESETMSTSTISRSEDINRLKDLEGSWEERYGKLRTLAIKLKGKIRELSHTLTKEQGEKDELQKKVTVNLKTIQTLQSQSDKLEDALECSRQECKQYLNRLNTIAEEISRDKQCLVSKDDVISDLKREIEGFKAEKQTTENWKKQVIAKVQTLRKEQETNNVLKKDFDSKIAKLASDLEAKEQALKAEVDSHKQTKNQLDASNNECKKNSVLNLEMQDYERSVKETSRKLEKHQEQISKLTGQVESQKSTINALREQTKILEERVREEQDNLSAATKEISTYKKKAAQLEDDVEQKDDKVQSVTQLLEISRSENEELSTELSKVIAEHQKTNGILKNERDHLRSQMLGLQHNLREVQDTLKLKEEELRMIQKAYQGYKVRAQSVLRQNQSRDVGVEEKVAEELVHLKAMNNELTAEIEKNVGCIKALEESIENLSTGKEDGLRKIQELEVEIDELKSQYAQLSGKYQNAQAEHGETVRSLKVHADTLSQCYRQQIADQEVRHNREIIELQSRIEKRPSPAETPSALPTMTREEGEGSESIESTNPPNVYPVPLERLLGPDSDQEVGQMKKQLNEQESKLAHLAALLSDTEQDLAKHVQMNKLLKEEIRRQQRSVEREKHAENLEYLKNVMFKFVTLSSGDERTRLVPVLNTILKLSPEETHKLNMVAKGDTGGIKGWTNYLPAWPSPSKPQ